MPLTRLYRAQLAAFAALLSLTNASTTFFYPNLNLTDNRGNLIQAHGGAIIQDHNDNTRGGSTFYWFGQNDATDTSFDGFDGVTCYRSEDMVTWDYLGLALAPAVGTSISNESVVERPKVLYNSKNKEYVMWFHLDNNDYGLAEVGVAKSRRIEGPYEFVSGFSPLGHQSRDMTVWQDPDTKEGYLVFATDNNANLAIAALNDDYTNTTGVVYNFTDVYWEAPGIIKNDDKFYLLVSPQNGWTPTPNLWMRADAMSGPWSAPADLAPPDSFTYLTQNAYDIPIIGTDKTTYIYFGDRWNGNELYSSTYAFMPLLLNETGGLSIHNSGGWALDVGSGRWEDLPYTPIAAVHASAASLVQCSNQGCREGKAANMTSTEGFAFEWQGESGEKVLQIQYIYLGARNSFLDLGIVVDGVHIDAAALLESCMESYLQLAPVRLCLRRGARVELNLLNWNGDEVLVGAVNVYSF